MLNPYIDTLEPDVRDTDHRETVTADDFDGPCEFPDCDQLGTLNPKRFHGCLCGDHGAFAEFVGRGLLPAVRKARERRMTA